MIPEEQLNLEYFEDLLLAGYSKREKGEAYIMDTNYVESLIEEIKEYRNKKNTKKENIEYPKRTIGYYLNRLPEPYRNQAFNNIPKWDLLFDKSYSTKESISEAFSWWSSPERFEYWNTFYNTLPD